MHIYFFFLLQSCVKFLISGLTVSTWLKNSQRSMEIFTQKKSENDSCIRMHIHRLQELMTIKYQMHYEWQSILCKTSFISGKSVIHSKSHFFSGSMVQSFQLECLKTSQSTAVNCQDGLLLQI